MTLLPDDADVGRTTPRRNVAGVPAQDGGIVRRCPTAVSLDVHPPADAHAGPEQRRSELYELRRDERAVHRGEACRLLVEANPQTVVINADASVPMQIAASMDAIGAGVELILGARLPTDAANRRAGRPVVLVRAEQRPDGTWAYHPVEIRNHRTLDVAKPTADPDHGPTVSALAAPAQTDTAVDTAHRARSHTGDLGWLAHSHRMLQTVGHASADAWGGVIGRELVVVWHRLDVAVSQHRWDRLTATEETVLDRYDQEFAFRLDVLAAEAAGTPIIGPVAVGECNRCPWNPRCRPRIEAADSTSLLPGFGFRQWYHLARRGITTRAQVAALDLATAALRDAIPSPLTLDQLVIAAEAEPATALTDLVQSLAPEVEDKPTVADGRSGTDADADADAAGAGTDRSATAPAPPDTVDPVGTAPPDAVASRGCEDGNVDDGPTETERFVSKVLHRLAAHGVTTTAAVRELDPTVVGLAPLPVRQLADAIEGARAQVSGRPQLRRTRDRLLVPGADLEIDLDMESALDGTVYLWGALAAGKYHAELSWAAPGPAVDAEVFVRFWTWLTKVRTDAAAAGRTVACYCWFRGAESGALRTGAQAAHELLGVDHREAVEAFLAGPEFVDLYEVFTRQLVTGTSAGLKTVAAMAGFAWRDEDPSGAASMAWHAQAVDVDAGVGVGVDAPDIDVNLDASAGTARSASRRADARHRLLVYNEDDVRATAAVRIWMRSELGGVSP